MNNKNVIALPASTNYTAEQALLSALEFVRGDNLSDALIVAYNADGELVIRASKMTRAEAVFMLEKARMWAMVEGGLA